MVDDLQGKAAEIAKKILTVGVGAIFLTEESLRKLTSDFKLPTELITGLLETASKTKNDFLRNISQDVIDRISQQVDPKALLEEILAKNDIEFNIKMKLTPKVPDSET